MRRRGNGEGSIYQRKEDNMWACSVTLENGKRKAIYGRTRKEVAEKLAVLLHDQQRGTLVENSQQTVEQFLTGWLENTHKHRVRPRTYERYKEAIDLHFVPALGHYQLQKLTPQRVQAFYAKTVSYTHLTLPTILRV